MTAVRLLPQPAAGAATARTRSDRLEILTALIAAPTFDPLFRVDVIRAPGDHPTYGWLCGAPGCERAQIPAHDFCKTHDDQWKRIRDDGGSAAEFLREAKPLQAAAWHDPPPCRVCPHVPARSRTRLCFLHSERWHRHRGQRRRTGREVDLDAWLAAEQPFPGYGTCRVVACPDLAEHPIGFCMRHGYRYKQQGRPGGAHLPATWARRLLDHGELVPVAYDDEAAFRRWCVQADPVCRMNGKLSLLGLRPVVKAEIQWAMFHHTVNAKSGRWALPWIQYLANRCRISAVNSLADVDVDSCAKPVRLVARLMLEYLRLVYVTRQDTKDAGFIETDHYGVRFANRGSHIDLSGVSQRWLRDLLWDHIDERLSADPPRSRTPFDRVRRGCVELSAYLQAQAPRGGHDPTTLTAAHMAEFVADQRHRAQHRLPALGLHGRPGGPASAIVTKATMAAVFDGARRVLRAALDRGAAERIGLDRAFIVALPYGGNQAGRRRPFPDEAARALANEDNLTRLQALDPDDRGLRDIWEALVLTGRRAGEVLNLRLECIGRYGKLPMFWHDQTKVGNYDQAIRIPERLYLRIEQRQATTVARFIQRNGRAPSGSERPELALFPRRKSNRDGTHGVSSTWFNTLFRAWVNDLDIRGCVPHQARHTLATNLLRNGATLAHVKRYLGQVSVRMAEHYVHLANTDPVLEDALNAVWVAGPGSANPGQLLSAGTPMTRQEAEALAIDLTRRSTPAEGGFCTYQPVVNGDACPWNMDCHNCDKFVLSGADLVYWHRKREQWRTLAERAPDSATANFLHDVFEPTARAIDGLEKALAAVGLLDEALALDLRRPQDYFGRVWSLAFRAHDLARHDTPEAPEAP